MIIVWGPPSFVISFVIAYIVLLTFCRMIENGQRRLLAVILLSAVVIPLIVLGTLLLALQDSDLVANFAKLFGLIASVTWVVTCLRILRPPESTVESKTKSRGQW
jgi:membrane associated rhomboid family serine protease